MNTHSRIPTVAASVALLALLGMVLMLVALVGRPLATADLWFHLKMGEWYLLEGLWPTADPMLHTNGDITPVQHEWLFGVAAHTVERTLGFQGLRVANVLSVILIIGLAYNICRRHAGGVAEAALGTGAFIILSWLRLMQDRPDRWSILSLLILYRLVLEPGQRTTLRRGLGAALLMLLWANAHSLFAIGLALIGVTLVSRLFELQLRAQLSNTTRIDPASLKRLGLLLLGCFTITLLNPRGIWQHLTFFTSSANTAVWAVTDEWLAFYPFSPGAPNSPVLPWLTWCLTDIIMLSFSISIAIGYRHLKREQSLVALRAFDPTLIFLGIVSLGAMLVSFRFLWLGIFPILYILQVRREVSGASTIRGDRWLPLSSVIGAAGISTLLLFWPSDSGAWRQHMSDVPEETDDYFETEINHARYAGEGAAFLRETGLTGRLFNNYTLGAYLGFQLAPNVRTFIDGRAEHYPPEVMIDYDVITAGAQRSDGRHYLDILDDRGVNLFYAVGGPGYGYHADSTMQHLEAVPWWTLVFRSAGHAIWIRRGPDASENLKRIGAFYDERGISFSPENGLDVGGLIREHTQYAVDIRLVPKEYPDKLAESRHQDLNIRLNALAWLGDRHRIAGDYAGALAAYGQILKVNSSIAYILEQSIRCLVAIGDFNAAGELFATAQGTEMPDEQLSQLEQLITRQSQWRNALARWGSQQWDSHE